jgi:hypothetical protein
VVGGEQIGGAGRGGRVERRLSGAPRSSTAWAAAITRPGSAATQSAGAAATAGAAKGSRGSAPGTITFRR